MGKKKKLKIKKFGYLVLVVILFLIFGIFAGINIYKENKYKETYEYKLMEHGYTEDETKALLEKFAEDDLVYILDIEKNSDIVSLVNEKYFLNKNFKEYIEYMQDNKNLAMDAVVRNINTHLDYEFYELELITDTSKDYLMLVNKYYLLDSGYEPDDLVTVPLTYSWGDLGSQRVRKITYEAFLNMWNAAKEENDYYLMIMSSYRDYATQDSVYERYNTTRGQKYADGIAARAGASEHQTGLSIDIYSTKNSSQETFKDSEEAKWLADNSYKYGFILRYPEDKVKITGYNYESWHFRYIGVEAATYCYNNDITFDEYYAAFVE